MGQILHGSATTTEAIRRAIQHSQESMRVLARRHGINPKTVAKWKKRESTADRRTGPTVPRSTVLTVEQEAIIVAFRKHTRLPLDDCLYALQPTIRRSAALRFIVVWNAMASAAYPRWKAISLAGRSSTPVQSASSTSTWLR